MFFLASRVRFASCKNIHASVLAPQKCLLSSKGNVVCPVNVVTNLAKQALRLKRDAVLQEDVGMVRAGLGADQDEALARRVHELRDREHRESVCGSYCRY